MTGITSNVLDTSMGKPGAGVSVTLERAEPAGWVHVGQDVTNDDGRVDNLVKGTIVTGEYRISFEVADYFKAHETTSFYPVIRIEFSVLDPAQHYHVPLLLNPFGYSTYRGS